MSNFRRNEIKQNSADLARVKKALTALKKSANQYTVSEMNHVLCECITKGTWVCMVTEGLQSQGYRMEMRSNGRETYAAWYTGPDEIKLPRFSLIMTDINKLLDMMYGEEADVNNLSYNNNLKIVPTFLCSPVFADVNNYRELLIDSGYYSEDMLR